MPLPWPPLDNRWQRGDIVDALYLADSEDTAWAECSRHLAERMIPPLAQMPRELWTWEINLEVANLSTDEKLTAAGLHPPHTADTRWPPYQPIGEQIATESRPGPLAPSAARPDGRVLALASFAGKVLSPEPSQCRHRASSPSHLLPRLV